jgi:oxygen-independent coproporphyrinogen-3 oxidase
MESGRVPCDTDAVSPREIPATDSTKPAATPLGLYLHFPFCPARCPYCAFYFVVGEREARDPYVSALESEIERMARDPRFAGREVATIYFGGGTPSLLEPAAVDSLLRRVHDAFPVGSAEVTLESNPDGLTEERLAGYRTAGVNRLTLGWQSFDADRLRALGRTHSVDDNVRSRQLARAAGFENVAVDLMFGLPGQSVSDWRREIEAAAELGPDHVSAYELTMEEGTRFFRRRGELALPDEDARAEMFELAAEVLKEAGIERYEISNFARSGHECRHNRNTWRSGDNLGIGASAASHVANTRWTNVRDLRGYMDRIAAGRSVAEPPEVLDEETWAAEDLYLGLRTVEGIDADARLARIPADARQRLRSKLDAALENGWLNRDGPGFRLTRRGLLLADSVFEEILV